MPEQDDNVIIKRILAGEVNAMREIVDRYKRQGFNLAYKICRNQLAAEEILQSTFINIYLNLDKFNFTSLFSTWFYRIVYNHSISYIRKINKTIFSLTEAEGYIEPIDEEDTIEEVLADSEASMFLSQAISMLQPEESVILHLYYYDEKKINEISEITGLSEPNIKIRLFRTRKKLYFILKRLLKKEFVDFYG